MRDKREDVGKVRKDSEDIGKLECSLGAEGYKEVTINLPLEVIEELREWTK